MWCAQEWSGGSLAAVDGWHQKTAEPPLGTEDGLWLRRETEEASIAPHQGLTDNRTGEHLNLQVTGTYQTYFIIYSTIIY